MVSFDFYFELFVEILFQKWVLTYSSYFLYINQTNTMSFLFNETSLRSLEVVFQAYRIGFWSFTCIFAFTPNPS